MPHIAIKDTFNNYDHQGFRSTCYNGMNAILEKRIVALEDGIAS